MAEVLQVFEMYLPKMAGKCVDLRVNYDKLPSFVENSLGQATFWQIVRQFVETLQVMLNERTKSKTLVDTSSEDIPLESIKSGNPEIRSEMVDASLVQITASKAEIDRRIAAFLRKKQSDVDIHNQREFCNLLNAENEFSCARVDAVFLPRVGQKSHITVIDAERENEIMESDNTTVDTMLYSLPSKRKKNSDNSEELSFGVQERLNNIESHLKLSVKSVEHDVYSRIKKLEEKILYLEGLSPEYFANKSGSGHKTSRRLPSSRQAGNGNIPSRYCNDLEERMMRLKEKLLFEKQTR